MAIAEDGIWAVGVIWMLTALVFSFVALRIYTRVVLVHAFGSDDVAYMVAFLFFVILSAVMTVSAHYGFGQRDCPNTGTTANALFYEVIGINVVGVGGIIAKISLGLFLLRIIQIRWQRLAIWGTMGLLVLTSMSAFVVYWTQCEPVAYMWDRRIKGGKCTNRFVPAAYAIASVFVIADIFFVIFPWVIIWKLNMNHQDKILIMSSLSFGLVAAACGIKRTIMMGKLSEPDFLKDSVPAAVWTIAEMAVTMMCTGVPVCLPFFIKLHSRWSSKNHPTSSDLHRPERIKDCNKISGSNSSGHISTLVGMARRLGITWTVLETNIESVRTDDEVALQTHEEGTLNDNKSLDGNGILFAEECAQIEEGNSVRRPGALV